jgi:hypothetical protein
MHVYGGLRLSLVVPCRASAKGANMQQEGEEPRAAKQEGLQQRSPPFAQRTQAVGLPQGLGSSGRWPEAEERGEDGQDAAGLEWTPHREGPPPPLRLARIRGQRAATLPWRNRDVPPPALRQSSWRSRRWRTGVVELKGEAWWSLSRRMARRPPRRPRLCSVPRFAVGGLSRRMAGGLLIVSANVAGLKHGSATRKELADGAMDLRVWRHWRPRKAATPWLEAEPREREGEGGGPARGGGAGE